MGTIPAFLLQHQILIEPYLGESGNGPVYGPAVQVRCFCDDSRKLVRNELGEQVVSEATAYCPPGTVAPAKSRVTHDGGVSFVLVTKNRDGGSLGTPDHVEVVLQ